MLFLFHNFIQIFWCLWCPVSSKKRPVAGIMYMKIRKSGKSHNLKGVDELVNEEFRGKCHKKFLLQTGPLKTPLVPNS